MPNLCGPLDFEDLANSCFSPLNRSDFLRDAASMTGNSSKRRKSTSLMSPEREKLEKAGA